MIKRELLKHWSYYLFLGTLFVTSLIVSLTLLHRPQDHMILMFGVSLFYIIFSLIHHKVEHDLHLKIFMEYVMMGALGITVIFLLLRFLI